MHRNGLEKGEEMKCPHCGSNQLNSEYKGAFACGTLTDRNGCYHQTNFCKEFAEFRKPLDSKIQQLESERDALQARVSELESEAEANAWKYNPAMAEAKMEQDAKQMDALKVRVKSLEEAGDGIVKLANDYICLLNAFQHTQMMEEAFERVNKWKQAKESKP